MKNVFEYYLRKKNFGLFRLLFLEVNLFWMKSEENGNVFYEL